MEPMISVIVPVYNTSKYLEKCVRSIINQSYKNLEIILVDDGSTDTSGSICDELQCADMRIRVVHKQNGGLSSSRNVALKIASGDYIGFVDSDDSIHLNMYAIMLQELLKEKADVVMCGFLKIYQDGFEVQDNSFLEKTVFREGTAFEEFVKDEAIGSQVCNKLFRSELFQDVQFPIGQVYEDISVMHRVFAKVKTMVCIPGCLYYYLMNQTSISYTQNSHWAYGLFRAFADRYLYVSERTDLSEDTIDLCLSKAVGFAIAGAIRWTVSDENDAKMYLADCQSFLHCNMDGIKNSRKINWKRKIKTWCIVYTPDLFRLIYKVRVQ